jgi:hypothetical protein
MIGSPREVSFEEDVMQKYVLGAALLIAIATPALAGDYYIGREARTGDCLVIASRLLGMEAQWLLGQKATIP